MTVWAIVWAKLRAAGSWCKANWKWLLPPVALLVWYFTRTKNVTVASGAVVDHDAVVLDANKKADAAAAEVNNSAANALKEISKEHGAAVAELDEKAKDDADKALVSPEATNEFLKSVSAGIRK